MSRNNPIGQGGQPPWRHPAEQDPAYGHQQGGQNYYFPPPEQAPAQPPFNHFAPAQPVPYPPPQDWGQQPDPRGYDLSSYMPADAQSYAPAPPAQYPQHAQHPQGSQHGYGESDSDFDEMLEDDEEPRSGRRALMIVAALIGAIGLGGGLAYTYKTFVAQKGGKPQLVKTADLGPSKVKPAVPGGKEFANTDKKLLNDRLDENAQRAASAASDPQDRASSEEGPRKVRVIPIPSSGDQASATPQAPVSVPGVTLDNNLFGPAQVPPGAVRAGTPPPPSQASVQPLPTPRVPQSPPVKVVSPAPDETPPAPSRQQVVAVPPSPPPAVVKQPVPKAPPPVAAAPAPQTTGSSGYVAVLSSQKSRMDALKAFADLQVKYGDVLTSRTPDVQEADLSARGLGTMYRLVVGPPGSRDAAASVCSQLKTAGYSGCWVMAY
jgi:hypothetical protein